MHSALQLTDLLVAIAPDGLCDECIRDRMPISSRPQISRLISELKPTHFDRMEGECSACCEVQQVTSYRGPEGRAARRS
jgi:hypothetical protein